MCVVDLINYLRPEGPHDLERIPTASEEDAPSQGDELINEEGDSKEKEMTVLRWVQQRRRTLMETLVRGNP